jgi:hypothetical protein
MRRKEVNGKRKKRSPENDSFSPSAVDGCMRLGIPGLHPGLFKLVPVPEQSLGIVRHDGLAFTLPLFNAVKNFFQKFAVQPGASRCI